jgi:hypothetical protein
MIFCRFSSFKASRISLEEAARGNAMNLHLVGIVLPGMISKVGFECRISPSTLFLWKKEKSFVPELIGTY